MESKLEKLRSVIICVRDIIKNAENVRMPYTKFEFFQYLANSQVKEYRLLELFKEVNKINPSFEESKSEYTEWRLWLESNEFWIVSRINNIKMIISIIHAFNK